MPEEDVRKAGAARLRKFERFTVERAALLAWAERCVRGQNPEWSAEDLLSEALVRLVISGVELRSPKPEVFRAYMIRSMRNLVSSGRRRPERLQNSEESEASDEPLSSCAHASSGTLPADSIAIDQLAFDDAAVIALRGILGLPFKEVAWLLGVSSPNAARVRHSRAVERLAKITADEGHGHG